MKSFRNFKKERCLKFIYHIKDLEYKISEIRIYKIVGRNKRTNKLYLFLNFKIETLFSFPSQFASAGNTEQGKCRLTNEYPFFPVFYWPLAILKKIFCIYKNNLF